jgi:hypothetical protein
LENGRLRRAVFDLTRDKQILAEALGRHGPALAAGRRSSRSAQNSASPSAERAKSLACRARPGAAG